MVSIQMLTNVGAMLDSIFLHRLNIYKVVTSGGLEIDEGYSLTGDTSSLTLLHSDVHGLVQSVSRNTAVDSQVSNIFSVKIANHSDFDLAPGMVVEVTNDFNLPQYLLIDSVLRDTLSPVIRGLATARVNVNQQDR